MGDLHGFIGRCAATKVEADRPDPHLCNECLWTSRALAEGNSRNIAWSWSGCHHCCCKCLSTSTTLGIRVSHVQGLHWLPRRALHEGLQIHGWKNKKHRNMFKDFFWLVTVGFPLLQPQNLFETRRTIIFMIVFVQTIILLISWFQTFTAFQNRLLEICCQVCKPTLSCTIYSWEPAMVQGGARPSTPSLSSWTSQRDGCQVYVLMWSPSVQYWKVSVKWVKIHGENPWRWHQLWCFGATDDGDAFSLVSFSPVFVWALRGLRTSVIQEVQRKIVAILLRPLDVPCPVQQGLTRIIHEGNTYEPPQAWWNTGWGTRQTIEIPSKDQFQVAFGCHML